MTPEETDWWGIVMEAWSVAEEGDYPEAAKLYHKADTTGLGASLGVRMPAALSLLRHAPADPGVIKFIKGLIVPVDPTENKVFGTEADPIIKETGDDEGLVLSEITQEDLAQRLREYEPLLEHHHVHNLEFADPQPHLYILSTGRCGTVSLYKLLKKTHYVPYHSFLLNSSYIDRLQQMCRYISGDYSDTTVERLWMKTRAAEWLGAAFQGRPMASCTHEGTIWAPTFAALHPKSKFIYLRRNMRDTFASFYGKNQMGERQLVPVYYKFPWKYQKQELSLPDQIMSYLKFTEKFSRAFGETMGGRFIEISSDRLFGQDPDELKLLRDFTRIKLPLRDIREHFASPINEKAHKNIAVAEGLEIFKERYNA